MEDKILELCKKVIGGEAPHYSCQEIDCLDCPFKNMKIDCYTNSIEIEEIAQNYIKEHEKTVNTIEKIEEKHKYKVGDKVRVKNLDPDKYHESLIDYAGEILTINKIFNNNSYYVNENVWIWDEDMLEPVEYKYKVGDKVRVKSDLKSDTWYNSVLVNCTMAESRNKILTIEKIVGNKEYRVEENRWLWGEDMFEPVEETVTLKELQEIKKDNIIPTYYHKGNYDVIQFCNDNEIEFTTGNIIKYITRYKGKNGIEDLKKAKEYLRRLQGTEYDIYLADLVHFSLENDLNYAQGKIIELVLGNELTKAGNVLNDLIEKEEKKIKEIEETYQTEGMAD